MLFWKLAESLAEPFALETPAVRTGENTSPAPANTVGAN